MSPTESLARRNRCAYRAGALPAETLPASARLGKAIPIDHVVVLMQENRSFDHYFSQLSHGGVTVAPADATNPDAAGNAVARFHFAALCSADQSHEWGASHAQWDGGKNDGFVLSAGDNGARTMGYYDETDLPYYYALARTFAISDMHFSSFLGPSWPQRMYLSAATSWGIVASETGPAKDPSGKPYETLYSALSRAGVDWRIYSPTLPSLAVLGDSYARFSDHARMLPAFFADAAAGTLPSVAVVEADFFGGSDEHPPADVQYGQAFVASVANAVIASRHWPHAALFLSHDEHGGFYDSVPPPPACPPDDLLPHATDDFRFDRYGFRVPLIVVSPYARPGYVSHTVSDHTSVIRFIAARFSLPALTARDANADALLDLFDFDHPRLAAPALPRADIDSAKAAVCKPSTPPVAD